MMHFYRLRVCATLFAIIALGHDVGCLKLNSFLSQSGIRGFISFEQKSPSSAVNIKVDLQSAFVNPIRLSWEVREFPVDYRKGLEERCSDAEVGTRVLQLDKILGELTLPDNESGMLTSTSFNLTGSNGIWGRSLLLSFVEGESDSLMYQLAACATIAVDGEYEERVAEVRFYYPVAGSMWFRWLGSSSVVDAVIYNEGLYNIGGSIDKMSGSILKPTNLPSKHRWKVFASDILDSEADKSRSNCNFLQILFDPDSRDDTNCSAENAGSCKAGDLTRKLGKLTIQPNPGQKSGGSMEGKKFYRDPYFPMPTELSTGEGVAARSLYVVLYDSHHEDSFFACAQLRRHQPRVVLANAPGMPRVKLTQYSPFEPTRVDVNATPTLAASVLSSWDTHLRIHEYPLPPISGLGANFHRKRNITRGDPRCSEVGYVYNPKSGTPTDSNIPRPGGGTQDRYFLGDLGGKHGLFPVGVGVTPRTLWDAYLPLHGKSSVAHRTLVAHTILQNKDEQEEPLSCAPLVPELPVTTAVAKFRYPCVGRILFRQVTGDPWADTSVFVEYLTYTDGSKNDTDGHRWTISESPIGKDFYNWSLRCVSAGPRNNPYKVPPSAGDKGKEPADCEPEYIGSALTCAQGDLGGRHGTLKVAGGKASFASTKKFFTDSHLSLIGKHGVVGHSVVLYDDFGPKARGERLGCSTIGWHHRLKAVAKDWFGSGEGGGGTASSVRGKIEMIQQSEYDDTDVEVILEGLDGEERGYYVHEASVEIQQEFPCEESTLSGTWDPFLAEKNHGPKESWAIGDLSGKHGSLQELERAEMVYNDTQLPLYGELSVIGRSVIIHRGKMSRRWACSTIERGYAPSEARELRAIASFHHPHGFAYGYIRMTQLIYSDGSMSDTAMEVKLRHPGKNDRNFTQNHNWAVFVNPVGQDAAVPTFNTRCVAGGYRWNPYYNQLADPLNDELYRAECGPDNPLRCDVGDISGRLGPIHLGGQRQLFTDVNLPLEGTVSAIGKSIVIYNKDRGSERYACANIEPDKDIIKYANIRKPPRFVTAQFIDDVREVMGLPEWMLTVDSRKTKVLHGGACIQFLLHFKGPIANRLEQDFSHLMAAGKLAQPSLYIPGAIPNAKRRTQLAYRPCGTRDPNEKYSKSKPKVTSFSRIIASSSPVLIIALLSTLCLLNQ
ncbi:uncharacterized protein Rsod [Hetaerina americana]|uniref:uncharacterized protein Rsod n=1 Tax=Hetaerina americana TaxID=62018 RepID=UPI003A7F3663